MAKRPRRTPPDALVRDRLDQLLASHRGKWVAIAPPSRLLGFGDTALEAYAAGQAAGEPMPAVWRVPTKEPRAQ